MSLRVPSPGKSGIRHLSFNQDCSCIAIADEKGVKIYSLETHKVCYQQDIGAVSVAEMLFCTSLLAFVGAGEQPALTPRKLTLLNTSNQNVIKELTFPLTVLSVRMNRRRLVVVLEQRAIVYNLETLKHLRTLETPKNPKGVAAIASVNEPCVLALPSSSTAGTVRVYDLLTDGGNVLGEISAHKSPVTVLAWNANCTCLASASQKGTVVRVHKFPQATKAFTFRRGSYPSTIHCLSFSPPGVDPPLLCAASEHGTIHVFRLAEPERHPAVSAASGVLSSLLPPTWSDVMEPQRCITTLRLPCNNVAAICAVQGPFTRADLISSIDAAQSDDVDAIMIIVATVEGILYEYWISGFTCVNSTPKCSLEGESYLFGHY